MPRTKNRPWNQSTPSIDLSLLNTVRAGDPPSIIQQHFYQTIADKYFTFNHIFTDGSLADEKVGYGVSSDSFNLNISSSLPSVSSIYSAEAYALMKGSQICSALNGRTVIFTDSASCLRSLNSDSTSHPWLIEAELASIKSNITFCWVPGHSGIIGNEKADRLAGAGRENPPEQIPLPAIDVIRWAKNKIRDSWNNVWYRNSTCNLRRLKASTLCWPDNKNPNDCRVLTRVRIGHTRLTHSYRVNKEPPPVCNTCGTPLTISHIIVDCKKYDTERLNNNMTCTLEETLSLPKEENLLKFLRETGLYHKI